MKNKIKTMIAATLLCLPLAAGAATIVSTNAQGQTVITSDLTNMAQLVAAVKAEIGANAPAGTAGFATTVLNYFTSFNPDYTNVFRGGKGYAYAGVDSIQGGTVSLANSLVLDYKVLGGLALDSVTRNGGVSGTIMSQSAGLAFNLPINDVNVALYFHGGYDFTAEDTPAKKADKYYGEVGARAMKALGRTTFAGVSISTDFPQKRQYLGAFAGFVF